MAERLYREIGEKIKLEIIKSKLKVGDKLPTERIYAELFGVSRTLVREAFIMLEIEKLIEVKKGSGSYLKSQISNQQSSKISDVGPFELLQARQVLESSIAACAAHSITKADLNALQVTLDLESSELNSVEKANAADRDFHLLIAKATQNTLLLDTATRLWDMRDENSMWQQLHERIKDSSYHGKWLDDHQQVFDQLRKRNAEGARQAMWQHLENVKQTLFELSDTDAPNFDGYLFANPQH
ncbi:HTH-type transcriptional regulator LutR [Marinomonas spartinae]|uniref:HTH-type transcriptional regulator LutR n=1 Tax=Marinomonas spartinae TaxID=1792290 RepID=A0A1A8T1Y9_9GAMM|nr:FCD domain-containing protein [Marinomonas spartinae]SBS24781.1 HTH-type transcriptional regulator LutR [Marinomonas spartinae]SBS25270.1 HTH-type transcriptional regulator LutR [Marinomonas spartinae]